MTCMEVSPFPYQGPLAPDAVQGRGALLADLVRRVTQRRVTALVGPRRYGKTSVLRRLAHDLTEVSTIWIDLYGVTSAADMAMRFDDALASATSTVRTIAQELSAGIEINLGLIRATLARPTTERPDPSVLFASLLRLAVDTALRTPTLLIFDEFSAIHGVKGAAAALRTALQPHYSHIGIIFAGSAPSVMRQLFGERVEPFYGQADLIDIAPLSAAAVHDIVVHGFAATGRQAGLLPSRITDLAAGHPQRSMQLADACWQHTPVGTVADVDQWNAGLTATRQACDDPMERLFAHLGNSEQQVLRVVANGASPHGSGGQLVGLAKGSATHARKSLLAAGDLIKADDRFNVTDPMMADWLRRTLPLP